MKRIRSAAALCAASAAQRFLVGLGMPDEQDHDILVELGRRAHEQFLILMGALRAQAEDDAETLETMPGDQLRRSDRLGGIRAPVAMVDDDEPVGREVQRLADLVARRSGAGDQHVGAARRSGDHRAHPERRHRAEGAQAHERHVVQRDDGRHSRPDRRRAGQAVDQLAAGAPRGARQEQLLSQRAAHPLPVLARQRANAGEVAEADPAQEFGARGGRDDRQAQVGKFAGERRREPPQVGLGTA